MNTRYPPIMDDDRMVYIRAVRPSELPEDVEMPPGHDVLYAIHDASGERLALTDNRDLAFFMARSHDRTPVSVH
jgi:hypothetical protein